MMRVEVNLELLQWAIERAGDRSEYLYEKFPHLEDWERGKVQPTLKQLESFAKAAYVPIGYFFLSEPPEEKLPVPDLRTVGSKGVTRPSPDLLAVPLPAATGVVPGIRGKHWRRAENLCRLRQTQPLRRANCR
jgi:hypothetical protein